MTNFVLGWRFSRSWAQGPGFWFLRRLIHVRLDFGQVMDVHGLG